jgi:hypothetical protein
MPSGISLPESFDFFCVNHLPDKCSLGSVKDLPARLPLLIRPITDGLPNLTAFLDIRSPPPNQATSYLLNLTSPPARVDRVRVSPVNRSHPIICAILPAVPSRTAQPLRRLRVPGFPSAPSTPEIKPNQGKSSRIKPAIFKSAPSTRALLQHPPVLHTAVWLPLPSRSSNRIKLNPTNLRESFGI